MNLLRKIARHPAAFPLFLLMTMLIAYGFQINRMGFYWDDWPIVYLASLKDTQHFWDFYSFDRPLSAWLYVVLTPLLGIKPVAWQLFAILARWVGGLGFWKFFRQIWPERGLEAGFATLLLMVYPGFSQQPIAMTYSLFWVLYALFIWSLWFSIAALKNKKNGIFLTILAVLASLLETLSMEYVIGLEVLRPIFFIIVLIEMGIHWRKAIKDALVRWIPYFLVLCAFVYYRFIYYPQIQTDPEANAPLLLREILTNPLTALPHLFQNIAQDLSQALVFAWGKPILPTEINFTHTTTIAAYVFGFLVGGIAVWLLLSGNKMGEVETNSRKFPLQAIFIGLAAVIMGGLPVWSTDRQIIVGMWSDRFSLGLMFGTAIMATGLAAWFSHRPVQRAVFLSIFLALGVAFQVQNTAKYKLNWDAQKDYYNQLVWRAPALQSGTAILGNKVPYGLSAEYSTGFALNTIYASQQKSKLPYWFYSAISDRGGSIPEYIDEIPLKFELRDLKYEGSTDNGVAVYYKYGESCLRVMGPNDTQYPGLDDNERELLAISHPDRILQGDSVLPTDLFGPELPHGWCYYFQKSELARQQNDWQAVIDWYRQSEAAGVSPRNGTEFMPIIEALANTGQWEEARSLTLRGLELTGGAKPYFCGAWQDFSTLNAEEDIPETLYKQLNCGES